MEANKQQGNENRLGGAVNRRVASVLYRIKECQPEFDPTSFIGYFLEHKGFSPKQLLLIYSRIEKFEIEYQAEDFKMILRKNEHKEQLAEMKLPVIKKLSKFMSPEQRKTYNDFIGKYTI